MYRICSFGRDASDADALGCSDDNQLIPASIFLRRPVGDPLDIALPYLDCHRRIMAARLVNAYHSIDENNHYYSPDELKLSVTRPLSPIVLGSTHTKIIHELLRQRAHNICIPLTPKIIVDMCEDFIGMKKWLNNKSCLISPRRRSKVALLVYLSMADYLLNRFVGMCNLQMISPEPTFIVGIQNSVPGVGYICENEVTNHFSWLMIKSQLLV